MAVARRLGRYSLGEQIGSGGLAEVFAASAEGADGFAKRLVVKRIRADLLGETGAAEALRSEARLAQRLSHGNVVHVFDYGQDDDGSPYIVMEHVNGCSVRALLQDLETRGESLCLADALFIVEEVAAALHYAHRLTDDDGMPLGIVHRDVKPGNILLSRDGVVKLTDFGIAKTRALPLETIPGLVKGTPRYLAPEQAAGRPIDARADVFGLGVVLLELLPGDADPALRDIGERATEPAPRDRFADVDAMADALHAWRAQQSMRSRPERLGDLVRRQQGRPRTRPIALDGALLGGSAEQPNTLHAASAPAAEPARRWPLFAAGALALGVAAWFAWPGASPVATAQGAAPTADSITAPETEPEQPGLQSIPAPAPVPSQPPGDPPTVDAAPPAKGADVDSPPAAPQPEEEAQAEANKPARTPGKARTTPGRLRVSLLPYAQVTVDGKSLGRTPVDVRLKPGRHRLVLHNPGTGKTVRRRIEIKAGQEVSIKRWE